MTTALSKLTGNAFDLTMTIPWTDVKKIYDQVFTEVAAEIEVTGFRKGKAPRHLIDEKVDKGKVYGEVVNRIVPEAYRKALEEHGLKPVISPQVKITQAEEEKDWQIIASAAEQPVVTLNDYKKELAAVKIWKPGDSDEVKKEDEQKKISEIVEKLLRVCKVDLAQILIDSETNRLLTSLVEDVRQAGLTYEQYLQSSQQTGETVRQKYRHQAEETLKLEFILEAIASDLKIEVTPAEIEAVINKETEKEKREALKRQSYVLASILKRDKTIAKLLTL